jgi:hypothetical protein
MSYILARDDLFVYDGFRKDGTSLVVPHVISLSYAVLAMLTRRFLEVAVLTAQLTRQRADEMWSDSLESESIPRRFAAVAIPLDLKKGTKQANKTPEGTP